MLVSDHKYFWSPEINYPSPLYSFIIYFHDLQGQLKLKEAALEMSSKTFLVKEEDLQKKIEDLEKSLEIFNQNAASFCGYECQKVGNSVS